jgi:hypothetical protein
VYSINFLNISHFLILLIQLSLGFLLLVMFGELLKVKEYEYIKKIILSKIKK